MNNDIQSPLTLDWEAVTAIDSGGMMNDVLRQPAQLIDALTAGPNPSRMPDSKIDDIVIAAVGGAGVASLMALSIACPHMGNRIYQSLNYRPPVSLTARTLFLAISYSGNSDSVVEQIRQLPEDVPSYIVTSGGELGRIAVERGTPTTWLPTGFSPRAAICHTLVAVLSIASSIGLGPDLRQELLEAVGVIDQLADEWGPSSPETSAAKVIARGLLGRIPVIHGSETTTAISRRWKTQLNETAGIPAFISDVIDSNQYEVEAWAHPSSAEKFAAIFLMDAGQSPGASRRLAVTRQQIEKLAVPVLELTAHGSNAVERILTQIMLADIVSVYVAVLRGKSPSETSAIDDFNGALFANSIRFSKSYGDEERKQ